MKTLYININSEKIGSSDTLDVLEYDLINDFYFALGEKLLAVYPIVGIDKIKLFTDYMDFGDAPGADNILEQWSQLKTQLFGEYLHGTFTVYLPDSYQIWLKYNENPDYCRLAEKLSSSINIDLEEFYEDSIDSLRRRIFRYLQKDDRYKEIDEIVFNDDAVARKSAIVRQIKDLYEDIKFVAYEKWTVLSVNRSGTIKVREPHLQMETNYPIRLNSDYSDIKPFSDGLAAICRNNYWGYIDHNCNEVIPCLFDDAMSFIKGIAAVRIGGKPYCINTQGQLIKFGVGYKFPEKYHKRYFCEGLCAVNFGKHMWGFVDESGRIVVDGVYHKVSDFNNGVSKVEYVPEYSGRKEERYIDTNGHFVENGEQQYYQKVEEKNSVFKKGKLRKIVDGDFVGYVNSQGSEVIPCKYHEVLDWGSGFVLAINATSSGNGFFIDIYKID